MKYSIFKKTIIGVFFFVTLTPQVSAYWTEPLLVYH